MRYNRPTISPANCSIECPNERHAGYAWRPCSRALPPWLPPPRCLFPLSVPLLRSTRGAYLSPSTPLCSPFSLSVSSLPPSSMDSQASRRSLFHPTITRHQAKHRQCISHHILRRRRCSQPMQRPSSAAPSPSSFATLEGPQPHPGVSAKSLSGLEPPGAVPNSRQAASPLSGRHHRRFWPNPTGSVPRPVEQRMKKCLGFKLEDSQGSRCEVKTHMNSILKTCLFELISVSFRVPDAKLFFFMICAFILLSNG